MKNLVILSAARTPIGSFLGKLSSLSGSGPRLGRDPGGARARRRRAGRGRAGRLRQRPPGGHRPGSRAPGLARRRHPEHRSLRHGPQGLRLGHARRHGRRQRDPGGRVRGRRRRRHGVDVERAVPPREGAHGPAHGQRHARRLDDQGRPLGSRTRTCTWATAPSCAWRKYHFTREEQDAFSPRVVPARAERVEDGPLRRRDRAGRGRRRRRATRSRSTPTRSRSPRRSRRCRR